jgi:hypothetical protein
MAQQSIRFRIRPDGRVEELVEGVQGQACEVLSVGIVEWVGAVQPRRPTAEAFQAEVVPQTRVQPATQASQLS